MNRLKMLAVTFNNKMSDMSLQRSTVPAELLCAQPLWALFLLLSYKHWRKYKYVGACLGRREDCLSDPISASLSHPLQTKRDEMFER